MIQIRSTFANHWFILLVPVLLAGALLMSTTVDWQREGSTAEAVLLFDACVTLPLLYWLCYRGKKAPKQLAIRMAALACLGVALAGWLVPAAHHDLIARVAWLRWLGLAVLALIEIRVVLLTVRLLFTSDVRPEKLAAEANVPLIFARLMALEARFWKAVWKLIRRR